MLSTLQGVEAVEAVLDATKETPTPVIAVIENKIVRANLREAVQATHEVAKAIEAKDFERAMALRDAEFAEYHRAYMTTTAVDQPGLRLPKEKVSPPKKNPFLYLPYAANANCYHPCRRPGRWDELGHSRSCCVLFD